MVQKLTEEENFNRAIRVVLAHEGGFVNDPDDPGGATNWGISLRWLINAGEIDLDGDGFHDFDMDRDGDLDIDDIAALSEADACKIYRLKFWEPYCFGQLPDSIAIKTFDLAVNMGHRQAFKLLQRACRANNLDIVDDGVIGPKTLAAIDQIARVNDGALVYGHYTALRSEAAGFYRSLAAQKPTLEKYLKGWLRRAYS